MQDIVMNSFVGFLVNNGLGDVYDIMYSPKILQGTYCSCNTSCAWFDDNLIINSRLVNYRKVYQSDELNFLGTDREAQTYVFIKQGFDSRNLMSTFKDGKAVNVVETKYPKSIVPNIQYRGFEDCRLVVWNGKLYTYGTRWDRVKDKGCICIYEIDKNNTPRNEIIVYPQSSNNCEKNWEAVEDQPFTFIYSNNPTTVVKVGMDGSCSLVKQTDKDDKIKDFIKGSTQVIRYSDNEYMSMVHTNDVYWVGNTRHADYLTAFIFYDNDFNVTRMSKWFVFNSPMCEFTCGLAKHNDEIYITYSQLDCTSHLIVANTQAIEDFMKLEENSVSCDICYDYYNMAKRYENERQTISSFVLFNYAVQMAYHSDILVSDEFKLECLIKTFCGLTEIIPNMLSNLYVGYMIDCLKHAIEQYPDTPEFYYMVSLIYKIYGNDWDEYLRYKQLGDERKVKLHNYFLKYFNPNYL